ncbi:MAG: hypothetical protein GVY18_17870 [Bacteroidetes bacterium]|jgi:hypothetical protein|nr:hypothetical protein [Bacteroidota bacterium]
MPQYPTPGAYQEALQVASASLHDPELRAATPVETALGLPKAITGAFAAVFPMDARTRRWAVKCFLTDVPDQRRRYDAIAEHLAEAELPYTIDFDYQRTGIQVEGRTLPVLKMAWVEGVPLNTYVRQHLDAPARLDQLADRWRAMLADLAAADVAHGDLQHGNVLVQATDDGPRLVLVDYDTMWVPALDGRKSPEVGHRNYQHPDRTERDFGPHLDHFPGLVIYTALRACAQRPDLFTRYDTDENLLFRAADFYDPSASVLFDDLTGLDEGELPGLVDAVRTACYLEPETVPPLQDVLAGQRGATIDAAVGRARRTWERARQRPERRGMTRSRNRFERAVLPVLLAGLLSGGILWGSGFPALAGGVVAVVLAGLAWGGWLQYRRLPGVRRQRRLGRELAYFDRLLRELRRQVARYEQQRAALLSNVDDLRAERLQEVQEEALYDKLKYHFIQEVGAVEGIRYRVVVRLKAAGIRTAYQATRERVAAVSELSEETRTRIALWRAGLVAQYADAVPDALSPAEERRFERYIAHRASGFQDELERLREKIRVQEAERTQVQERLSATEAVTIGRYVLFVLRLTSLPSRPLPPAPTAAPPPGDVEREAPVPASADTREEWWKRAS